MDGDGAVGTATGTAAVCITTAVLTTGMLRGMVAITVRVVRPMEHTAVRTMALATTLRPGPLRAVGQCQHPTGAQLQDRCTTLTPVPMVPPVKTPTPMGVLEVQHFQEMARP